MLQKDIEIHPLPPYQNGDATIRVGEWVLEKPEKEGFMRGIKFWDLARWTGPRRTLCISWSCEYRKLLIHKAVNIDTYQTWQIGKNKNSYFHMKRVVVVEVRSFKRS